MGTLTEEHKAPGDFSEERSIHTADSSNFKKCNLFEGVEWYDVCTSSCVYIWELSSHGVCMDLGGQLLAQVIVRAGPQASCITIGVLGL